MGQFLTVMRLARRGCLLSALLLGAGCTSTGSHTKAIKAVDDDEVIAAAEKDSFPAASAPVK